MIDPVRSLSRLSAPFWLHLGRWFESRELGAVAATCYRNANAAGGRAGAEAGLRLARNLLSKDKNRDAAAAYAEVVRMHPENARAWCGLGASRRRQADMDGSRKAYEEALRLDPEYAEAWSNLGEWHLAKGNASSALDCFEQALRRAPGLLEALNNRVAALYELGCNEEAEEQAQAAIVKHPREPSLHVNLGNIFLHTGRVRLAVKAFQQALEYDPTFPEALLNIATVLGETGYLANAVSFIQNAIAVKGESAQRLASLALAQKASGDLQAAEITCCKVLDLQPGNASALITLAGCRSARADHQAAIDLHRKALLSNPNIPTIYSNIAFDSTYVPDLSAQEVFSCHRDWADRFEAPVAARRYVHKPDTNADRPLRIGYVSGDFGRHPVGFLLRDVARRHNQMQFHIYGYSMERSRDDINLAIAEGTKTWVDALLMSDEELAERIHHDHIDILVDLSGHTAYNRLKVFALRPAPIQATWIGYFHSTGLESIDYFITDPYTSPRGCGQLFSETPVYLPNSRFCYWPPEYAPEVSPPPVLESGRVTFGSFNRVEKLVAPVIDTWARIVAGTQDSRLIIKSGGLGNEANREHLRRRFTACGLSSDRLELRDVSAHSEMLAEYGEVDIALDPFPFNGGMTTLEALWMGVPVVTMACGQGVVARQTFSALSNLGLASELAFANIAEYIQGTINLAGDLQRLGELRQSLRRLMAASPLRKPDEFVCNLEELYRRMWRAWCRGEKLPSHISVA